MANATPVEKLRKLLQQEYTTLVDRRPGSVDLIRNAPGEEDIVGRSPQQIDSTQLQMLLRQQDEYIEQLEEENKLFKEEMKNIRCSVFEVTEDNQRILRGWKADLYNQILTQKHVAKGLSDEEKMLYNENESDNLTQKDLSTNCLAHTAKIRELESEVIRLRKTTDAREADECSTGEKSPGLRNTKDFNQLKLEHDELVAVNGQLVATINKMKLREDEAQSQVKRSIQLVEEAHLEKTQALTERDRLQRDLQNQQRLAEDTRLECEQKLKDEVNKVTAAGRKKLEEAETEVMSTNGALEKLKVDYDRIVREKSDVSLQLRQLQDQLDETRQRLEQTSSKLQEEKMRVSLERSAASEEISQLRMGWERSRQEQAQELSLLRSSLEETEQRLKRVEHDYLQAKKESMDHSRHYLLRTSMDDNSMLKQSEERHSRQWSEMEKLMEQQMDLVSRYKEECKNITGKMETLTENHRHSSDSLRHENHLLQERLKTSSERCRQMEMVCQEHERQQKATRVKLEEMKNENYKQNEQLTDLMSRHNLHLKEREFLHGEMNFLFTKLNENIK